MEGLEKRREGICGGSLQTSQCRGSAQNPQVSLGMKLELGTAGEAALHIHDLQ